MDLFFKTFISFSVRKILLVLALITVFLSEEIITARNVYFPNKMFVCHVQICRLSKSNRRTFFMLHFTYLFLFHIHN